MQIIKDVYPGQLQIGGTTELTITGTIAAAAHIIVQGHANLNVTGTMQGGMIRLKDNAKATVLGEVQGGVWCITNTAVLIVKGIVQEGVMFQVLNAAKLIFEIRPPESVVTAIDCMDPKSIIMPDGNGSNNNNNSRNPMTSTATLSTSFAAASRPQTQQASPVSQPALADGYNEYVLAYIDCYKNKKPLSVQIAELNLTSEEKALFEEFKDPITFNYMDIPVQLNEKFYDLSTIAKLKNQDPVTKYSFKMENIGAGRLMFEKFEIAVNKLNDKRKEASQRVASTSTTTTFSR